MQELIYIFLNNQLQLIIFQVMFFYINQKKILKLKKIIYSYPLNVMYILHNRVFLYSYQTVRFVKYTYYTKIVNGCSNILYHPRMVSSNSNQ